MQNATYHFTRPHVYIVHRKLLIENTVLHEIQSKSGLKMKSIWYRQGMQQHMK